ncbi:MULTISPECIES: ead/Ea22-like family protein [Enterobacter]|uniref:ead/Ea22-like family protein n=1 Tax=Enterobacter TaxID=547 RepID=UPI001F500D9F|nr:MULTISPECIES: ead/Ea22-like family protein [Enterobacter]MCR1304000.1 ead/Ea22-like family protein [Enterobacter sp. FL1277]MCR1309231.1 ead/Ea22-like family protein [Enterobacter sp. BT1271]MCR1314277.1 ead/Ea22-like family protein [Enterobacter sp. BT855]MCR1324884.1 ead/Ea22-like family protein [Enterobacter sp. BT1268]MCR1329635.1 ead/Ea22-like family protein [Enterobacter sp. BT1131]
MMNSRPMSSIDKHGRQVQRYANYGVDMMEWAEGGYVKHSDYLALLDELEAKDKRLNEILKPNMLLPVIDDMDADNLRHVIKTVSENYSLLHAKWEAAEKRIAELSASHGKLREAMAGIHNTITGGCAYTPLAAILNASKSAYEESAAAAGKGE